MTQQPYPKLFDVTCVIGTVYATDHDGMDPREVAFNMIAHHGAEGTYSFPREQGGIEHVTVEWEEESETAE